MPRADRGVYVKTIGIRQGRNTLLVKTLNKYGDFSFALNICEVEKDPNYYGNRVYNLGGCLVRSLCGEMLPAGEHEFTWDLDNEGGSRVSPGVYVCSLACGDRQQSLKILVE